MIKLCQATAYDPSTGLCTLVYVRPDACEKCGACGGQKGKSGFLTLKAECKPGDWVTVEMPDDRFLHATAVAYIIPLVCFLAGMALGYTLFGGNELAALVGCAAGLGLGVLILFLNEKRIAGKPEWTPRVTGVYCDKPGVEVLGCGHE